MRPKVHTAVSQCGNKAVRDNAGTICYSFRAA
jgi:hypothetical protein